MTWIELTDENQIPDLIEKSALRLQVIFKHSTRCAISSMARNRLEKSAPPPEMDFYFLDLLRYPKLSERIAEKFSVYHESPQVLMIRNGDCIYDQSHSGISMTDLAEQAALTRP